MLKATDVVIKDIPQYHPLSVDYKNFWREQRRKCIEGAWASGMYIPPALYYYVNFHTIRLNKKGSALKTFDRPWLRDVEYRFFNYYTEARGFSGFADDDEYSSNIILLDEDIADDILMLYHPNTMSSSTGQRKTYIPARKALFQTYEQPLGRALFENPLQNFMLLGSRESGKSYMVSSLIGHNFLMDGATVYNEFTRKYPDPVELLVGAEKSDRSADLLKKVRDAFDQLPGKQSLHDRTYPSPFSKRYKGSWEVNKEIIAEYKKKEQGAWEVSGSKSSIKHRSFAANSFAAQGTRPLLLVLEEAGMFSGLKDVYANTVDNLRNGLRKTGMLMMLGTGGDMTRGTLDAAEMFYEPDKYGILAFEDTWEHRGKIGYFLPAYEVLNEYKDPETGVSNIDAARKALINVRKKKAGDSGGSEALNKEMQYRPIVPSEMFLTKTANIFPTAELRRRLSEIQTHKMQDYLEKKAVLYFDPDAKVYNGVNYEINEKLTAINKFPYEGEELEGAVILYELPKLIDSAVPKDAYIIGCDPYKDDGQSGTSLASIYVIKTNKYPSTVGFSEIVATYIGRPYLGKNQVNEILYKLSLFYGNAKIYFENNVGNVKDYFEKIRRLDLLARQPVTIFNRKAAFEGSPQVVYGYPLSNDKVKWEALQYVRSFLLEDRGDGKRNLDLIPDPALLQELIAYNLDGNFDRVSSLIGCILGLEELSNLEQRKVFHQAEFSQLEKDLDRLIINNNRLFNVQFTQTTTVLRSEV